MNFTNAISSELLTLAPFLSTIEKGNPFRVPYAYFNQFAQNTLDVILENEELSKEAATALALKNGKAMTIPQNYFETLWHEVMAKTYEDDGVEQLPETASEIFSTPAGFFESMQANVFAAIKDAEEDEECRNELNFLSGIEETGLTVPPNYFRQLQSAVMERILNLEDEEENTDTSIIDQAALQNPFALPAEYFENASEVVLYAVSEKEYESEIVNEIAGKQDFEVPHGYFEQLQNSVFQSIKSDETAAEPEKGKTVSMPAGQRQTSSFVKYAMRIAAMLTILFVGWQLLDRQETGNNELAMLGPSPQLLMKMELMMKESGLTSQDLKSYISNNAEEFENIELEELGIDASSLAMKNQNAKDILLTNEAMDLLDISADEIEDFLNE
ncbi:MAG: hypothetical protein IPM47_20740 [Sphingobacteriales bacterium]|nr:MAG: hypothetical protein IPM47_20740 [Sphingobacteriales bacterium]